MYKGLKKGDKVICSRSTNKSREGSEFIVSLKNLDKKEFISISYLEFLESYGDRFDLILPKMSKPNKDSIIISKWAKLGADKNNKMCSTCAFKLGSDANLEELTVSNALHSVESTLLGKEIQFNCHPKTGYGNTGRVCGGYKNALRFFKNKNVNK